MPASLYVELKKARKPSNPPAIGLDWMICDRDGVAILKHSPVSCGDVAHAFGRDLRASKRMGGAVERDAQSNKWQLKSVAANARRMWRLRAGSAQRRHSKRLVGPCVDGTVATLDIVDLSPVSPSSRFRRPFCTHTTIQAACFISSSNFCSVSVYGHHRNSYERLLR
jgi:hypothetical protein